MIKMGGVVQGFTDTGCSILTASKQWGVLMSFTLQHDTSPLAIRFHKSAAQRAEKTPTYQHFRGLVPSLQGFCQPEGGQRALVCTQCAKHLLPPWEGKTALLLSQTRTPQTFLAVCESWCTLFWIWNRSMSLQNAPVSVLLWGSSKVSCALVKLFRITTLPPEFVLEVFGAPSAPVSPPTSGTDFKYLELLAECVISSHFDQQPFDLSRGLRQPSLGYFKQSTSRKRLRPR